MQEERSCRRCLRVCDGVPLCGVCRTQKGPQRPTRASDIKGIVAVVCGAVGGHRGGGGGGGSGGGGGGVVSVCLP